MIISNSLWIAFYFLASSSLKAEPAHSDIVLQKQGSTVCAISDGTLHESCYQTLLSLGVEFAEDVEQLYPQIALYNEWLAFSPNKLPTSADYLSRMGGAILLDRQDAQAVVEQLSELNVRNLSVQVDSVRPLKKIPFALTIDWKDGNGRGGTLNAIGSLEIVDGIFSLDLNHIFEFRERFVSNLHVESISGDAIPMKWSDSKEVAGREETLKRVIAPCLAGKWVSLARISFNQIKRELQERLQDEIDKIPPRRPL